MNQTFIFTPLPGVLTRLVVYAGLIRHGFPLRRQANQSEAYLCGLLQAGQRKRIEPLVDLPAAPRVKHSDQCLQNLVNQADRDEQAIWRRHHGHMA